MTKQKGFTVVEFFVLVIWLAGIWGWVWNIVKIAGANFSDITGLLVLRIIGVFVAPLGAVLGFL